MRGSSRGKGRAKERAAASGPGSKRLSQRALALSAYIDDLLLNMDRYHLWWTGPPDEDTFHPKNWSSVTRHRPEKNAVFTMAIIQGHDDRTATSSPVRDFQLFLGTLRRVIPAQEVDVVIALESETLYLYPEVKKLLQIHQVIAYEIPSSVCLASTRSIFCGAEDERVPASVFRYFFYEKWAAEYSASSLILAVDFRDVIFQSNPFVYHLDDWFPDHQLAVFQEFYPNMVISRCRFNRKIMEECYGQEALRQLGRRVIISSGGFIGTRDALLAWSHFMTSQLQEAPGRQLDTRCTSGGIEHSFVNYLIYGNKLRYLFRVKVFAQGDGCVNSLGGLRPDTVEANITGSLRSFWRVLSADGWILNWDGEVSPVVHQLDHYKEELDAMASGAEPDRGWQALAASRCLWGCS